jgi:hypothetical protein
VKDPRRGVSPQHEDGNDARRRCGAATRTRVGVEVWPAAASGNRRARTRRAATRAEGAAAPPGNDEEADAGVAVVKMD